MSTVHRVLITSVGGNTGQGVLKALRSGHNKYHIVGIDMEPKSAGFSFCDGYYATPRTGSKEFESELDRIIDKEKLSAIFVCSPTELPFFSTERERLEKKWNLKILVNSAETVRIGNDKLKTAQILEKLGLPFPKTCMANDESALEELLKKTGFPLLLKPLNGASSQNVFIVKTRQEIELLKKLVPELVAQQYLPDDSQEYTATTFSDSKSKVVCSIVFRRDLLQGTTYRTERVALPEIEKNLARVAESMRARASTNFQFRIIEGKAYVFEINPRFSGTSGIRFLYGFNDPEMAFDHFVLGKELISPQLKNGVALRYWNEVFIEDATFELLEKNKVTHHGKQFVLP